MISAALLLGCLFIVLLYTSGRQHQRCTATTSGSLHTSDLRGPAFAANPGLQSGGHCLHLCAHTWFLLAPPRVGLKAQEVHDGRKRQLTRGYSQAGNLPPPLRSHMVSTEAAPGVGLLPHAPALPFL